MITIEDEIIEEGWFILNRERDGLPCSLHRARLRDMCMELAKGQGGQEARRRKIDCLPPFDPSTDWQLAAAHDDSFETEPAPALAET